MKRVDHGILNCGEAGTPRAISTFPSFAVLTDGSLFATYRVGTTKDSEDEMVEVRRSNDGGRTWSEPETPFPAPHAMGSSVKEVYITPLGGTHLLAVALIVDRETYPGKGLFNEETEGVLPLSIALKDSHDNGKTWTDWRIMPVPDDVGPPSLTNPVMLLPSGRLAMSLETNKDYQDSSKWYQRVDYFFSDDNGQTWNDRQTVSQDPSGRIFYWDQRAGICPDGRVVTYSWTYDSEIKKYLNIRRSFGSDEGTTWTEPEDIGITDQASHPAILPDGRVVLAWVDRFQSQSIKARMSVTPEAPFLPETEVELYKLETEPAGSATGGGDTGELLAEMSIWNYGLPFADVLPGGDVLVLHYEGDAEKMQVCWSRLAVD
jgi:hypothetical protein